jgi:hypothetical protein
MERTPQPGDAIISVDADSEPAPARIAVESVLNSVDADIWLVTDVAGRAYLVREGSGSGDSTAHVWMEVLFGEDTALY